MNVLGSIDVFKENFLSDKKPYWRMYHGSTIGKRVSAYNSDESDLSTAWDKLEERLSQHENGTFTIVTKTDPRERNDLGITTTIRMGTGLNESAVSSNSSAFGGGQMLQFWNLFERMEAKSNNNVSGLIQAAVRDKEMEFKLEELKREMESAQTGSRIDRIIDGIIDHFPQLLPSILNPSVPPGVMGTAGIAPEPTDAGKTASSWPPIGQLDLNGLADCASRIQAVFTDTHANEVIFKLAAFCEKHPDQAKSLISKL